MLSGCFSGQSQEAALALAGGAVAAPPALCQLAWGQAAVCPGTQRRVGTHQPAWAKTEPRLRKAFRALGNRAPHIFPKGPRDFLWALWAPCCIAWSWGGAAPTSPPSSPPVLPLWGYSTVRMKITHVSQFVISPKRMRGLETDQSRGVAWWVHSSKARVGCFSLGFAIVPREKNISLWIHVHVPLRCPGAVAAAPLLGFARQSKPLAWGAGSWSGGLGAAWAPSCAALLWEQHPPLTQCPGAGAHSIRGPCDASKNNWRA